MSRIELIFGGILALAVIAAGSFVLFQNGLPLGAFQSAAQTDATVTYSRAGMPAPSGADAAIFTGNRDVDLCTCYEAGFRGGAEHRTLESVAYRGGFTSCRNQLGAEGGTAWTEGWANGAENKLAQRSCRIYLKRTALQ